MGSNNGSWLDDPEWDELRRRTAGEKMAKPSRKPILRPFTRKLGVISKTQLKRVQGLKRKQQIGFALVGLVVISGVVLLTVPSLRPFGKKSGKTSGEQGSTLGAQITHPSFEPALPSSHKDEAAAKLYYPQNGVVCFPDKISTVEVKVCEQDLPENYKADPENGVKKIATDFGAKDEIHESTPTSYFGQSIKGPEYTIFLKNNHLVFINSPSHIEKTDWATYITQLK